MTAPDPLAALCAAWLAGEDCGCALYDLLEERGWPWGRHENRDCLWAGDVAIAWAAPTRDPLAVAWRCRDMPGGRGVRSWGAYHLAASMPAARLAAVAALRRALKGDRP